MTIVQRRIITLILFLVLITLGPGLILYGAGYRLNLEQKRLVRAGLLHVTTEPENAIVTVNGRPYSSSDELILPSLTPGMYDIAVEKEGFHSWFKRLEILPGQSTFIRNLNLFVNTVPEVMEGAQAPTDIIYEGDQTYIQSGATLLVFQPNRERFVEITLPSAFQIITPAEGNDGSFYFQQNARWFRLLGESLSELAIENGIHVQQMIPASQQLYLVRENQITQTTIDAPSEEASVLEQNSLLSARKRNDGFWTLSSEPSKRHIFLSQTTENNQRPTLITSLPYQDDYQITEDINGFLTIYSPQSMRLVLVDTNIVPALTETYEHVTAWEWSANQRQLLVATEFELFVLHLGNEKRQELLMRLSTKITEAAWEAEENHVFFISGGALQVVERDERYQRNVTELANNLSDAMILSKNREALSFSDHHSDGSVHLNKLRLR